MFMFLATYIKDDLAARLKSGRDLPVPLTIDSLAAHYEVSFTPVRTAVEELIADGLLNKGPNRRLVARSPSAGTQRQATKLPEMPRDPFDTITHDLVQLSLKGEPVYLREEATAEKYNMSRSAIRNILHRLAGEGVLDHIPRRGWRLRPFRQDDLQAFIEVREILELKALELARPKLDVKELQRFLAGNQLPDAPGALPQIDESFHQYLVNTSGNRYIMDFFERKGRYYQLLFKWEDHDPNVAIETIRQHREILTAMLDRNWAAARKALSYHILKNHPILSQITPSQELA